MIEAFMNSPGTMTIALAAGVVTSAMVLRVLHRRPWK